MMSLHRSMHSSQMNTDGPAISLRTSCWFLPQKEQCKALSSLEPFFSGIGISDQSVRRLAAPRKWRPDRRQPTGRSWEARSTGDSNWRVSALVVSGDQNLVDQPIRYRIFSGHNIVALCIDGDPLYRLSGIARQNLVQTLAQAQDLLGLDLDIRGLPLSTARRLVDHDA